MPKFKHSQKAKARYLYFSTAATQKEIAASVGISEKTMTAWVRNGNWPALKRAAFYSPDQEADHLYEELRQINDKIVQRPEGERYGTKEELEAKQKIISMLAILQKNSLHTWRNITPEHEVVPLETHQHDTQVSADGHTVTHIILEQPDGTLIYPECPATMDEWKRMYNLK